MSIKSKSPDVVAEAISNLVAPCSVSALERNGGVDYFGDFIGWSDFALGEARTTSGLIFEADGLHERLICAITTSGHLRYRTLTADLASGVGDVLICDSQVVERAHLSEEYGQFFLTASMETIDRYARDHLGARTRSIAGSYVLLPQSHLAARALTGFAPLITQLLMDKDLLKISPVKMRRCQDAFLNIVASCMLHEGSFLHLKKEAAGSGRHIVAAEQFMREHAKEPIGVAEVASAIGISVRSLQLAYKRHAGTTPLARLQRLRLEGLHAELSTGAPLTWRLAAAGWGYVVGPRIFKQYVAAFGEAPEQTLFNARSR